MTDARRKKQTLRTGKRKTNKARKSVRASAQASKHRGLFPKLPEKVIAQNTSRSKFKQSTRGESRRNVFDDGIRCPTVHHVASSRVSHSNLGNNQANSSPNRTNSNRSNSSISHRNTNSHKSIQNIISSSHNRATPSLNRITSANRIKRSGTSSRSHSSSYGFSNNSLSSAKINTFSNSSFSKVNTSEMVNEMDNFEELDAQIRKCSTFQALHRIHRRCMNQNSLVELIQTIEHESVSLIRGSVIRVYYVKYKKNCLCRGDQYFPVDNGITGHAATSDEIIRLTEPGKNPHYNRKIDSSELGKPENMLCIPVHCDVKKDCSAPQKTIAVFQALRYAPNYTPFSDRDVKILVRLGEFCGNLIKNLATFDRIQNKYSSTNSALKRYRALVKVSKALASGVHLKSIVSTIVRQVPELLNADRCTLYLVDNKSLVVARESSAGRARNLSHWFFGQTNAPELPFKEGEHEFRLPIDKGLAGTVATTGQTINIPDAHQDQRFNPDIDMQTGYRTRSMLCVPMYDSNTGKVTGVIQVINKSLLFEDGFDKHDEILLKNFCAQAALAVRNSKMYDMVYEARKRSEQLFEVTTRLSKTKELSDLLSVMAEKVKEFTACEQCTVFILDQEKGELYTTKDMSFGEGAPLLRNKFRRIFLPLDQGIAGSVATTSKTINILDAYSDKRFNPEMDKKTGFKTKSILCMAITSVRNEVVGVVEVMNKKNGKVFTKQDEEMLMSLCAQAATGIENKRLYQKTEHALNYALADNRFLTFLLDVTKNLFSDVHVNTMIGQIQAQVHHLLKADDCCIFLLDGTDKFYLANDENSQRFPLNRGIAGITMATSETILILEFAYKDPRFNPAIDVGPGHQSPHSILCCPIYGEKKSLGPIGVISVKDEKDRGGFGEEEEKLLTVFCMQAGVAISNSQQFSNLVSRMDKKKRDEQLHSLREVYKMNLEVEKADSSIYRMDQIQLHMSIGTGSYGHVYKGKVEGFDEIVAIKKLHIDKLKTEQLYAFSKEAALMYQLKHPNVVRFIGAVTEPSNLCIITEFCARGSLAEVLINPNSNMTFERKLQFSIDAAMGMQYLHSSNPVILHRDLKSDNLLVGENWVIKVADFGLTRFIDEKASAMTQVGTPMWMAPEIIKNSPYSGKADVYAYGIILWEILTCSEPYAGKNAMEIVVDVVNLDLRPEISPKYTSNPLVPLMKSCWHPDANERPIFSSVIQSLKKIGDEAKGIEPV